MTLTHGFHQNVPMETYLQHQACNSHYLKDLLLSPARADFRKRFPPPSSKDQEVNSAYHKIVLEPHDFDRCYGLGPDLSSVKTKDGQPAKNPAATVEGKELIKRWAADNPGKVQLSNEDWDRLHYQHQALLDRYPLIAAYLGSTGDDAGISRELTVICDTTDALGRPVQIKSRPDVWRDDGVVLDLKNFGPNLDKRLLISTVLKNGYHLQAALARQAAMGTYLSPGQPRCGLVFQSIQPPYDVVLVWQGESLLNAGRADMIKGLTLHNTCTSTGHWPGAEHWIEDNTLELPAWADRDQAPLDLDDIEF